LPLKNAIVRLVCVCVCVCEVISLVAQSLLENGVAGSSL
jgi:hypothetical protein